MTLLIGFMAIPFYGSTALLYYGSDDYSTDSKDCNGFIDWVKDRHPNALINEVNASNEDDVLSYINSIRADTVYYLHCGEIKRGKLILGSSYDLMNEPIRLIELDRLRQAISRAKSKVGGIFIIPDFQCEPYFDCSDRNDGVFVIGFTPLGQSTYQYKRDTNTHSNAYNVIMQGLTKSADTNGNYDITLGEITSYVKNNASKLGAKAVISMGGLATGTVISANPKPKQETFWDTVTNILIWIGIIIGVVLLGALFGGGNSRTYKVTVEDW